MMIEVKDDGSWALVILASGLAIGGFWPPAIVLGCWLFIALLFSDRKGADKK